MRDGCLAQVGAEFVHGRTTLLNELLDERKATYVDLGVRRQSTS